MSTHRAIAGPPGARRETTPQPTVLEPALRWVDSFDRLAVGQRFRSRERTVSEADVTIFCALTGDWHPQHCDPGWAATSPFGERIAHGMLVLSLAAGLVPFDPEHVLALRRVGDVVFKRPVRFGDAIFVTGEISALRPIDEGSGLVDLSWTIRNQDEAPVARAKVQVLWRTDAPRAAERGGPEPWDEAIFAGAAPGDFIPVPL
ncbi:MAG: MaoC family dehydratase N-terminal domain-containing protein [Acidobacteriota bacterium]|nr:MaoC family dehydratase N-terminal domain-containing protein [Acidobacteriota bacterium]